MSMTQIEIAARYFAAEYAGSDPDVIAEIVAGLNAAELDTIAATVEAQPWLIEGTVGA
jgi:hypothetical protein